MNERTTILMYAVRIPVVLKYVAQLILVQAVLFLLPAGVALSFAEYEFALRFGAVACLLVILALPFIRLPVPAHIQINEALLVTVIAFILGAAAMVYPFMTGGEVAFMDAVFESVSGITTTGLSTLTELQDKPKSFLFARAWMQWYGGLGFVVLAITLMMGQVSVNRRLLGQEFEHEKIIVSIRSHAQQVTLIYVLLTVFPILLLSIWGVDVFSVIVHVLSAVSTGGFSSFDNSLAGFDSWPIEFIVSFVGLLGAISFPLYYRLYQYGFSQLVSLAETYTLLLLIIGVTVLIASILFITGELAWLASIQQALLLAVSAQTTTGFSLLNSANLDPVLKGILVFSMSVGGDIGSTAGGFKVLRFLILLKLLQFSIQRTAIADHAVCEPQLAGKTISMEEINDVLTLLGWFMVFIFVSWLPFIALGYAPLDALFEVVSATSTVGLSSGITQADLQAILKLILCIDMLAGRLEIIALLVFLYPKTWFGRRIET